MPAKSPSPAPQTPRHVAIIMDGNGRWAAARGKPRVYGHKAGAESVRRVVEACGEWGVGRLTLYAFSTENWKRPRAEVTALMSLLARYLRGEVESLNRNRVRLSVIGDLSALPKSTRRELDKAIAALAGNTGLNLTLALNYGSRDEIVRAARQLAARAAAGELDPEALTEAEFAAALDTAGMDDPDLVIRTGGEMRLSNFLLWQASYAEFYSTSVCWPDFDRDRLAEAFAAFNARERRYGGV